MPSQREKTSEKLFYDKLQTSAQPNNVMLMPKVHVWGNEVKKK